ncbi:MAG: F0F1 ATP synthase subunit delta [Pelomonas sp.]|nr:F0F1 ATP synthase subunit delta [Roseateles sp.]
MAEIATIARPYAEALFEASGAQASADQAWLGAVAAVAGNAELLSLAGNPKVTPEQLLGVLTAAAGTALPARANNFLATVLENGRLAALPEIAAQFHALVNAQSGAADAVVHSAFAIDGARLAELGTLLERRFGRKLNLQVALDPELIGGVRVVVDDEVLDLSVRARLEQMKVALAA